MYYCCVRGCKLRSDRCKELSFHCFPKTSPSRFRSDFNELISKRREAWFQAIPFKKPKGGIQYRDINELDNLRICSKHFKSGECSSLYNLSINEFNFPCTNVFLDIPISLQGVLLTFVQ